MSEDKISPLNLLYSFFFLPRPGLNTNTVKSSHLGCSASNLKIFIFEAILASSIRNQTDELISN